MSDCEVNMPEFKAPEISVDFYFRGLGLDPTLCTEIIALQPTSVATEPIQRGKLLPSGEPNIRPPFWSFELKDLELHSLSEAFELLLDHLWPRREAIRDLIQKLSREGIQGGFSGTLYAYEIRPACDLTPEIVSKIAYFGLGVHLSFYDLIE